MANHHSIPNATHASISRRLSLLESSSLETLRDLEEYVDATLSGSKDSTPQLKLCYQPHSAPNTTSVFEHGIGGDQQEPPSVKPVTGLPWLMVSFALAASNLLFGMNATMIGNAQIFITDEFGEVAKLGWIGVGFALGTTLVVLPLSRAMDIFDNKWLCMSCLIIDESALALCGAAPTMNALIVGRVWGGIAGTGLFMM